MRRLVVSVVAASGLVLTGVGTAHAEPAPEASAAKAAAGKKVCKVTDSRLDELSGIVATDDGFVVINDGSTRDSHRRVFFLDEDCKVADQVSYSGNGPRDTEDLILSADGKTLWIADIGDNDRDRETIGLWKMPADGSKKPKLYRLSYPDDDRHDAEALLLNGDGTPIIVTKEVGRPAALYTPTAELKSGDDGVPMRKVGEVTVPPSTTSGNTFARLGRGTISGGAVAPGGAKVVLRTYTDALEWTVTDGDVLGALKGEPRVTPLPDEPLGEAITYSPDGANFFTVSDMQGDSDSADNHVLRYTPVTKTATAAAADGADGDDSGPSWFADLSINDITYMVGGVGVLGAILVGLGVFGIMRARKRPEPEPALNSAAGGPKPTDPETELLTVGGAPAAGRGSGVYGGNRGGAPPGVYSGGRPPPAMPPKGGGVYGGGGPGTGQPAGRPGPGQPAGRPGPGQPAVRPGAGQPPGRPGPGQPAGRPVPGQPPGRPGQGGQPGGRPGAAGRPAPGGTPPMGRPAGGRPPGNGVYGEPPQRPQERNNFADLNGYSRGRDFDNPGYGRTPQGR